jgi:hypothetical protein
MIFSNDIFRAGGASGNAVLRYLAGERDAVELG